MRFLKLFLILILIQLSLPREALAEWGLSISPPVIEIRADNQEQIKKAFEITNLSGETTTLDIKMIPFVPEGQSIQFLNVDLPIKNFIAIEDEAGNTYDELTLRAQESRNLILHIFVPENLQAQDYYFLITFLSKGAESGEGLSENQLKAFTNVRGGIGINVLLAFGKEELDNLELVAFSSPKVLGNGPVEFKIEVKNAGDHFLSMKGRLSIINMFGQKMAELEIGPQNILAQGTKIFTPKFTENFLLGPYNAQLEIDNSRIKTQTMFVGLPVNRFSLALALVLFLLLLSKRIRRRLRS